MVCLSCRSWSERSVCPACLADFRSGGVQRLESGLLVRSAFRHEFSARRLVHRIKFESLQPAGRWLAEAMMPLLDGGPGILVPVPRSGVRRLRYGVDPALVLAKELATLTGRIVVRVLSAPLWTRTHTGRNAARRHPPMFFSRPTNEPIILVDDVVTTGSTLQAAERELGDLVVGAVTATRALKVTSLLGEDGAGQRPGP
jgi:predicted amidophosphoribosyltransferase